MNPSKAQRRLTGPFSYKRFPARLAVAGVLLAIISAPAQTTNMAELRELRGAPSAFRRVAGQIESVSGELKTLDSQLAERRALLEKLSKQSEQCGAAIRALCEGEIQAREHLSNVGFKFHLVDLTFAAWRLKHSDSGDVGMEALPDVLEESLENEPARPVGVTNIPGGIPADAHGLTASPSAAATADLC